MDQNASANVPASQSDPGVASAPANTQTTPANDTTTTPPAGDAAKGAVQTTDPGAGVADKKPSFDPEIQKFLDNQNIKTDDMAAAITELAKRNMKLRGNNSEAQSVAEVLNPQAKPAEKPAEQPAQTPEKPAEQTPPQTSQPHTLSDMDIATVSLFIEKQFPSVKTDAQFYKDMIADGFRPTTADGQINLRSVQSYAAYKQKLADAAKAIADNQPKAGQLPQPSNAPETANVDRVQTMTADAAGQIIMWHNNQTRMGQPGHPQYEEAVKFLQDQARNGK